MKNYSERAARIMPTFTFWGDGIVVVTRKEWLKAEQRIIGILQQLKRKKVREKPERKESIVRQKMKL